VSRRAGIIYGTDVFCALVQRPALAQLDDATMAAAYGVHGDGRVVAGHRRALIHLAS
jgi:hypothetical protein